MGRPPTGKRKFQLKHLTDQHHEILRLTVTGKTAKEVATALGVSRSTVSYVVNSRLGMAELERLRRERDKLLLGKLVAEFTPAPRPRETDAEPDT